MKYGIGPIPDGTPEDLRDMLTQMRNLLLALQAGKAGIPPSSVTGLSRLIADAAGSGPAVGVPAPDLTPPPQVSGVVIAQSPLAILIRTANPTWTNGGGQQITRVYGFQYSGTGPLPTFSQAVVVCEFVGQIGSFDTSSTAQWRLWLTWVSNDGVESATPAGGANGFAATAQAVDDSMVVSLSAAKLNVGDGTVGGTLKSSNYPPGGGQGWIVTPAGYFEANNGIFRGSLDVGNSLSGQRTRITTSGIRVYDAAGAIRVKLGDLS
jgi:hypothetical protein